MALTRSFIASLISLDASVIPTAPDVVPDQFIIESFVVERKLAAVDAHKASGPDDIPNWLLRDFSRWLVEPVCSYVPSSIHQCVSLLCRSWLVEMC